MKQIIRGHVSKKFWGIEDSYLNVDVQVDEKIFKAMDRVIVTIEHLPEVDIDTTVEVE